MKITAQMYVKIIFLTLALTVVLYIIWHHVPPQKISNENPQYDTIAKFVTDDISRLAAVDSSLNRGGLNYSVSEISVTENEAMVSLILIPVLPKTDPRYFEYDTEFYYVLSLNETGMSLKSRPNKELMKNKHIETVLILNAKPD